MPSMAVDVTQLQVHYPGREQPAVAGVNLRLAAGEMGVLIGPSGCGKTTLLRAIAGLEPVSAGSIRIEQETVSSATVQIAPEQRRVGMVFQDYALFPHMDVATNVGFGLVHTQDVASLAHALELRHWPVQDVLSAKLGQQFGYQSSPATLQLPAQ